MKHHQNIFIIRIIKKIKGGRYSKKFTRMPYQPCTRRTPIQKKPAAGNRFPMKPFSPRSYAQHGNMPGCQNRYGHADMTCSRSRPEPLQGKRKTMMRAEVRVLSRPDGKTPVSMRRPAGARRASANGMPMKRNERHNDGN